MAHSPYTYLLNTFRRDTVSFLLGLRFLFLETSSFCSEMTTLFETLLVRDIFLMRMNFQLFVALFILRK